MQSAFAPQKCTRSRWWWEEKLAPERTRRRDEEQPDFCGAKRRGNEGERCYIESPLNDIETP